MLRVKWFAFNETIDQKIPWHTTKSFICHPKSLHKHCLQFLLGVKMVPKRIWKQRLCKILGWQTKSIMVWVWYVMVFSGVVNWFPWEREIPPYPDCSNQNWQELQVFTCFGCWVSVPTLFQHLKLLFSCCWMTTFEGQKNRKTARKKVRAVGNCVAFYAGETTQLRLLCSLPRRRC